MLSDLNNNQTKNPNEYIMRTFLRDAYGVNYSEYSKEVVDITQPFPEGTFLLGYNYAIEDQDKSLRWLRHARLYMGEEYCEFYGQKVYEERGDIIWSD